MTKKEKEGRKKKKEKKSGNCLLGKSLEFQVLALFMHSLYSMKNPTSNMTIFWRFCVGFKKITLHIPVLVSTHTELLITPNMSQSQQASGTTLGYAWQKRVFQQLPY